MSEDTELLREAVALLRLIAEPQIAKRDEKLRSSLYRLAGQGKAAKAVQLMDGTRTQATIYKSAGMDQGGLSRLIKALKEEGLVTPNDGLPKLTFPLPQGFPGNEK